MATYDTLPLQFTSLLHSNSIYGEWSRICCSSIGNEWLPSKRKLKSTARDVIWESGILLYKVMCCCFYMLLRVHHRNFSNIVNSQVCKSQFMHAYCTNQVTCRAVSVLQRIGMFVSSCCPMGTVQRQKQRMNMSHSSLLNLIIDMKVAGLYTCWVYVSIWFIILLTKWII